MIPVALVVGMAGCTGDDGSYAGPPGHPPSQNSPPQNLEIRTWYDLDAVRNNLAGNHTLMNDLDFTTPGYWELAAPIANQGKGWEPIGFVERFFWDSPFGGGGSRTDWYGPNGTFDGQGYEIRDLSIDRPIENDVGLFGVVNEGGVIKDIGVVNVTVIGEYYVGGLVGRNRGTVSNSYYNYDEVLINGDSVITIGALSNEDFDQWLAHDKFLDVNERFPQEDGYYVVRNVTHFKELLAFGQDDSLKFRLANDLDLGDDPNLYIPYLAAQFDGNGHKILNLSLNFDFVSNVGLFGYLASGGKVTQVGVENVNVTGTSSVGGLVGGSYGTVSDSYSTGSVTGDEYVGGLVGLIQGGTVSTSYSTGNVNGNGIVGGLVGVNDQGTVSNSYSTGNVNGNEVVGGLVGYNKGTVSDSFWDVQTSGQTRSAGGTGKTTAKMKNTSTFSGAGWKITAVANPGTRNLSYIWNIVNGVTYPFLSWESVS